MTLRHGRDDASLTIVTSTRHLPQVIEPMLPVAAPEPFDSPAHLFEVLWDGVRALAFAERGSVRLQDRWGRDITHRYPELTGIAARLRESGVVIDGEIVCLDDKGRPDFQRLQARLAIDDPQEAASLAEHSPVTFQAFDLLYRERQPVTGWTLRRRKEMLRTIVRPDTSLAVPDHVAKDGLAFFEAAREHGLDGIVAKEVESRYLPGQCSRSWLTVKVFPREEFVIAGFTYGGRMDPRLRRLHEPFASLLVGQYDNAGRLHYAGEVTGGFDNLSAADHRLLDEMTTPVCPFADEPRLGRLVFWCRPELAATVRYGGWTPDGRLQFPIFEALRPDVPAASCTRPEGDE